MMRLESRVAIVTGAGKGIGKAIAIALSKEGAAVAIADINKETAKETASEVEALGRKALALKVDVTNRTDVEAMVKRTVAEFGKIDILVNNAGVSSMARVVDLSEKDWDFNMDVNSKGQFLCSKSVAKYLIDRGEGGRIINIASVAGKTGSKYYAHYNASKAAVIALTASLALELASHHITVNAICPGMVETDMQKREKKWMCDLEADGRTPEDLDREFIEYTPCGRLEQPEDVAKAVVFLATDDSEFITGQAINVSGGIITVK
ncbi:MAG: SDR family NAD(P)-dependent oxidoreductase [Candidatus Atabeyarchaeum deiterrae]